MNFLIQIKNTKRMNQEEIIVRSEIKSCPGITFDVLFVRCKYWCSDSKQIAIILNSLLEKKEVKFKSLKYY